jgi:hypothetical protein
MTGVRRLLLWFLLAVLAAFLSLLVLLRQSSIVNRKSSIFRGALLDRTGRSLAADDSLGVRGHDRNSWGHDRNRLDSGSCPQNAAQTPQSRRSYPLRDTLANLIGFVGGAGLEYSLDSILRPRQHALGGVAAGHNVQLTIDLDLQRAVFRRLREYVIQTRAARGSAVVLRPETGEVLALADYPGYDPQRHGLYPPEVWRCHAVMDEFEPGCHDTHGAFALVAGLAELKSGLRGKPLTDAACELGFGARTGIELADEAAGNLQETGSRVRGFSGSREPVTPGPHEPAPSGVAQVRVSLLQLAQAYGILAADGRLARPHLVKRPGPKTTGRDAKPLLDSKQVKSLTNWLARTYPLGDTSVTGDMAGIRPRIPDRVPGPTLCAAGGLVQQTSPRGDTTTLLTSVGFPVSPDNRLVVAVQLYQPLTGYYAPDAADLLLEAIVCHDTLVRQAPATAP